MKTSFVFLPLQLMLILFLASCSLDVDSSQDTAEVVLIGDNGTISPKGAIHITLDSVVSPAVTPSAGYTFKQWNVSGSIEVIGSLTNPQSALRVKGDGTVTAMFEKERPVLTIKESDCGTITKSPDSTSYPYDTKITLTATPNVGYKFTGWSWDLTGMTNPVTVSVTNNKTITATFAPIPGVTGVVYVRKEATGLNDGSNWVNAYTDLETAFANSGENMKIWIAGGTYKPTGGATAGFTPQNGSQLFGGFSGFESDTNRLWSNNFTILTGNDFYHYVLDLYNKDNIKVNGFIIENGVRNCVYIQPKSSTISSNIIIANCIIRNNNLQKTYTSPQAIHCDGKEVIIKNCVFYNNLGGDNDGQALHISKPGTRVENCMFLNNDGPAISSSVTDVTNPATIISCTIYGNKSKTIYAGGIRALAGAIAVRGCILYANTNSTSTGGTQIDSAAEVSYCCIQDCSMNGVGVLKKTSGYSTTTNFDVDPMFNTTAQPSNDEYWFRKSDVNVPFIPSNTIIVDAAQFTNGRPTYDIRGCLRSQKFDFGSYEAPYVGP